MTLRITHRLLDRHGGVKATWTLPVTEAIGLEPWMQHKIHHEGWRVISQEPQEIGVDFHGMADWREVAQPLAEVVCAFLDEAVLSEDEANELLARAERALDHYDVTVMEVGAAQADVAEETQEPEPDQPSEEGDDGEPAGA
jgi:hypothetical protein